MMFRNINLTLQMALEYADLGLRVIPLGARRKNPWMSRWPDRASTDPATITKWFERWPDSNIGIATGRGLIALDVDPRHGGKSSLGKLLGRRRLPDTAQTRTGGNGDSFLFKVPPHLHVGSTIGLRPGLDLIAEGGQIVVEPSVHPTTRRTYVWMRKPSQGIAEAPGWLLRLLRTREPKASPASSTRPDLTRSGDDRALLDELVERFPIHGPGMRNDAMVRAVGSLLGRGYSVETTERVLVSWWFHFDRLGRIRTPVSLASQHVSACIRATRDNPAFVRSTRDHDALRKRIRITARQGRLLTHGVLTPAGIRLPRDEAKPPPHSKRVTNEQGGIGIRLCRTNQETAYVRAWLVHVTYKIRLTEETVIRGTREQLRLIIQRDGFELGPEQFERLKRKFVSRPKRPASRFELLVQTLEGSRGRRGEAGRPSEFEPTGILELLSTADRRVWRERRMPSGAVGAAWAVQGARPDIDRGPRRRGRERGDRHVATPSGELQSESPSHEGEAKR